MSIQTEHATARDRDASPAALHPDGRPAAPGGVPPSGGRSIVLGGRRIPVVGPSRRDPRLHLALVILSVLLIGTVLLDFRLSIPQIVITVFVCAVVEAAYRLWTTGALMWPASGMQTATSTVLVLRVVGVEHGDWWTFAGVHWFVGVAVLGLLSKYLVRTRHGHVFNPSNVALVAAFLVLGARRVEPLDYWWGPLDWRLALAYAVIVGGGIVICGRLGMLQMVVGCWLTIALGVGVLAALGHSITARWSFAPVEGWHLWTTIVLSPETLVFVLFMITDPKTAPRRRSARFRFGIAVGIVSSVLLAPWPTEFGSKVGLLAGLTVMSVGRFAIERPVAGAAVESVPRIALRRRRGLVLGVATTAVFVATVAMAGFPNRRADRVDVDALALAEAEAVVSVRRSSDLPLPDIVVDRDVAGISRDLASQGGAEALVRALLFNLDVEAEAIATGDAGLLAAVDHGQRLIDLTRAVESAAAGDRVVSSYELTSVHLSVVFPGGFQSGPNAGVTVTGVATDTTFADDGSVRGVRAHPFSAVFTMRRAANGTWLTTGTLPPTRGDT